MHQSPDQFFDALNIAASNALVHAEVVRTLIFAALPERESELQEIGFKAKFLLKTWNVMRRLGAADPAREQLKKVFYEELNALHALIRGLLEHVNAERREFISQEFLATNGDAFSRMLELLKDLSWIKNVEIDQRGKR